MFPISEFDSIRPYNDDEVAEALHRLKNDEAFIRFAQQFFPDLGKHDIVSSLENISSIKEFQDRFVIRLVHTLVKETTKGLTIDGLENLKKDESYLFVSDHRDIILDSALLNVMLYDNDFATTEIAIGSNLLIQPWIIDLVKLNKSFIVTRNISVRKMLESSNLLSSYIRYTLSKKKSSIWIAQREGRTKDGDDRTQQSLLKMINMSGSKSFAENFRECRIVPVAISYEYEPCDIMKTNEVYLKEIDADYKKSPMDDLRSMMGGMVNDKGRVHFSIGKPIVQVLDQIEKLETINDKIKAVADVIDYRIHKNFKLWPYNFIAYDLLNSTNDYKNKYSDQDKNVFLKHVENSLNKLDGDKNMLQKIFLELYSNPVKNRREIKELEFLK